MKKLFGKFTLAMVIAGLLIVAVAGTIFAAGPSGAGGNSTGTTAAVNCGAGMGLGAGPDENVTKLLGMTEEQIQEQRQAGKSLVQIAATKNISEATLINAIIAGKQDANQKLVAAGTITQAQADLRLAQMKDRVKLQVNRTTVGPPEWAGANGNGQKGMMGQGNGNQANCNGTGTGTGTGGMKRFGKTAK
jgi:hypothetical protein